MRKLTVAVILILLWSPPLWAQIHPFPPPQLNPRNFDILSGAVFFPAMRDLFGMTFPPPGKYAVTPEVSLYTVNATNDSYQDMEPTVASLRLGATDYTTTVYFRYTGTCPNVIPRNRYASTTNFVNFTRGQLFLPSGHSQSADPLLDANIFSDGVAPGRLYCTGIVYNGAPTNTPNSIALWRSNNGGITWSVPTIVARNDDPIYFLDKPAIKVSWASDATKGHVYVAYIKYNNIDSSQNQLLVSKSLDGGMSFGPPAFVTSGLIHAPQILVNPFYGYAIYAIWVDYSANAIRMSRSLDYGASWSTPETAATGNIVVGNINGGVRATTVPMARFNSVANKMSVVWHEWEAPGSTRTDVYYTAKSSSGWQSKVRINDIQTNDQFMPALDFDNYGNMKVSFNDRRDDPNNLLYHLYVAHIDSSGNNLLANERISTFQSNPQNYCFSFIGDYQDIWNWNFTSGSKYHASWIGIPSVGDVYLSGILP
jgi:hypothetical protein